MSLPCVHALTGEYEPECPSCRAARGSELTVEESWDALRGYVTDLEIALHTVRLIAQDGLRAGPREARNLFLDQLLAIRYTDEYAT